MSLADLGPQSICVSGSGRPQADPCIHLGLSVLTGNLGMLDLMISHPFHFSQGP